ncbi:hypothetical protein [Adhaeribacter pallidiroseus]|uniref:Uncharacterized protein n=1 Tax=Adhaeribacter pallidiroseus TaxID=2072847 RepID=A0A369QJG7_9BACT|nr:hypothetical protein [Adhaeribacter pallidiroseus]RDC64450.1 hypothetical protein AHMF7616_03064 [Adhaeribacter pallidiroseus]
MADDNKGKKITDDKGDEFTFDETAESNESDLQVIDVTDEDEKKSGTVTDEERQASFEMD